jgi:hypothetical protein
VRGFAACFLLGVFTGQALDYLAWAHDFPHLATGWLARLSGADGEGLYEANSFELMLDAFLIYLLLWSVVCVTLRKRRLAN